MSAVFPQQSGPLPARPSFFGHQNVVYVWSICFTGATATPYVSLVTAQLGGISTLVVDDDPDNLEILAFIISAEGATVRTARDGREALDLLPDWKPDVVLLDIEMPNMDGYALLRAIRSQADLHNVPAIAVTALSYPADKDRAFASGFEAHVAKPFDATALIELIEWLASRPRGRDARAR